jgi:hypothetical protein
VRVRVRHRRPVDEHNPTLPAGAQVVLVMLMYVGRVAPSPSPRRWP